MFHCFIFYFLLRCTCQLSRAGDGEHIQMDNDSSEMIRGELRQANLVWLMDAVAHVLQHCASKGWKSVAALLHTDLREAH